MEATVPKPEPPPAPPPTAGVDDVERAAAVERAQEATRLAQEQARVVDAAVRRVPLEFPLDFPVTFGSAVIDRFTFQPLTVRVIRSFPVSKSLWTLDHYANAVSLLANQPPQVVDSLAASDFDRMVWVVSLFWMGRRKTSGTSSGS